MSEEERKKVEQPKGQISRRDFLRDAGLVIGGATIGSMALLNACKGATTETVTQTATKTVTAGAVTQTVTTTVSGTGASTGAATKTVTVTTGGTGATVTTTATAPAAATGLNNISITVNKNKLSVAVEDSLTLHQLIHDRLGWTGIKEMCNGFGACGSCTTIVNGRPVLACLVLACECNGAVIETPEGASMSNPKLLDAMIMNYCAQCGYCSPGFLATSKALLDRIPKPTEADIREALGGNICRCATYQGHIYAVQEASGQRTVTGG